MNWIWIVVIFLIIGLFYDRLREISKTLMRIEETIESLQPPASEELEES